MVVTTACLLLGTALSAHAVETIWTGWGAGADQWSDPNCWSDGVPGAGDTALFATEGYLIHFDGDAAMGGLALDPNASGGRWLILGEYTLTTGSIRNDSTDDTVLDLATDLTAPVGGLSIVADGGPIVLAGGSPDYVETLTLDGDLTIDGGDDAYVYGPITGSGGLTKNGSGTLLLHVTEYLNDFTGDVTLNDGLLVLDGYDSNDMENPTGDALGAGDVHLYGGTLGLTGNLGDDYEMLNPGQTIYVGGADGNAVTIDAAHVESQIDLGGGVSFPRYAAGLGDGESRDVTLLNSLVLGYDTGSGITPANLVLGNPLDGDELLVELDLADESDYTSSTITLQGAGVQHNLTAYAEVEIEQLVTGDGGLNITADSTSMVFLANTGNDFAGGVELNGGMLVVNDSNQTGTSALGTGTFAIHGDALDPSQVVVVGAPMEIYYNNGWKDDANDAWDGSFDTVEIGNDVEMQGKFVAVGWSGVEMDDWFDDGNDVPVALIGSNIDISGTTTLTGDTEIAVVAGETDVDDDVPEAAVTALHVPENYFTLEISGAIGESGGSYGLTKHGEATLNLTGVNTFNGGYLDDAAVVQLDAANAVAAAPVTVAENGTVEFGADQTFKALSGSGLVDAQANNLTLGNGQSDFDGTLANLRNVTISGGAHVIDANLSVESLAVNAGTLTMDGDLGSDNAVTIANGATAVLHGDVEFYFGDAIENSGTLVGDTNSLGDVAITMKDNSTVKADEDGLVASSVSIDAGAGVTLDSSDGLVTLADPTFNGFTRIAQTGDNATSISNLDNHAGNTIMLTGGMLYLTGTEIWAGDGMGGGGITASVGTTLIVDAPTQNIFDIAGGGTIVKTVNVYASQDDYFEYLGTVDGNDLTLADATIATGQGSTLEISRDVEIETGSTVEIIGQSTVVVGADQTLTASDNATLDVGDDAQMQINGALNVDAGQTLNIAGGGTVAINSNNASLGDTATLSVANATLSLGNAAATGSAQVALNNAVVEAAVEDVEIETAALSGTVSVTGNTLTVNTLDAESGAALSVETGSGVQVNGQLNVGAGTTLGISGGGTLAINSNNAGLGATSQLSVGGATLTLGNAAATGSAQLSLTSATVQASVPNVAIQQVYASGEIAFTGNAVSIETLRTTGGSATLTTGAGGVEVGTIGGPEDISVAGGRLTLTGDSSLSGQTITVSSDAAFEIDPNAVLGGSVVLAGDGTIDGTVLGTVIVNDANAVLDGSGVFEGGLAIMSGTLEPGHSPGQITISGTSSFILGSKATLNVEVDEEGNHDSILIDGSGSAILTTGAKVVAVAIGNAPDGTYDIVTVGGSGNIVVDGQNQTADANLADFIQNTELATITSLTVDDTAKVVEMSVDFMSNEEYLTGAGSRTVRSFGSMLDSNDFSGSASDDLLEIVGQAQASDDVAGSYAQMTNQLQASASTAASSVVTSVNTNLGRRMQDARAVARDTLHSPAASPLLASLSPTVNVASAGSGLQGFFQGYGSWGDRDNDGGVVGYDYNTYGSLFGAEQFIREDILLGGSLGYGRTDVDNDDSLSSLDVDSLSLSLYGTWFNNDRYASLTLGYGYHSYDSVRNLEFADLRATGDFSAQTVSIAPEVGKLFRVGSFGIEPYAGLNYTYFTQESYTEKGAGDADLSVEDDRDDIVFSELGTRFRKTWAFDDGGCLSPQVKLAWRHDFSDEVVTVAQLAGASTSFRTTAIDVVSDVFDLGVGVDWQIDKNKALCTQYDAELGSGFTAHTLQACVKILF